MLEKTHYTAPEIARLYGVAIWQARRAVDGLGETIPRAGLYRLVPREMLARVKARLMECGHLDEREEAASA